MKGDFTRFTFNPHKHYSRVLMQQGRVQLDADWNEMVDTQLHFLRALAADLIGPHGAPSGSDGEPGEGFKISLLQDANGALKDLNVFPGHYYVKGILCENEERVTYKNQPHWRLNPADDNLPDPPFLIYLDVWERHVTCIEDTDESERTLGIREVALRGPDTTTRAQIVWQVRCQPFDNLPDPVSEFKTKYEGTFLKHLTALNILPLSTGKLSARARKPSSADIEPCLTSPEARYRGAENQLYRVEIHTEGTLENATFKWSRENCAVAFPINKLVGDTVTLEHLGHDDHFGLRPDDWIEIVDDDYVLQNRAEELLQIKKIDPDTLQVTLNKKPSSEVGSDLTKHPLLRRWNSAKDSPVKGPPNNGGWITLEDGVEIHFDGDENSFFRTGDYWLIPARVETGDVEWPRKPGEPNKPGEPQALEPHGVKHHYAPLAVISSDEEENITVEDCRRIINPLWKEREEL
jgi:hypothetical protein